MILQTLKAVPLPVALSIVALFMPVELSLFLGGMRLSPHRVIFLVVVPFAVLRLLRRKDIRIHAFDVFFLLYNVWTVAVFLHHGDASVSNSSASTATSASALNYGGSLALESFGGYIVARAYIRDWPQARAAIRLLCLGIAFAALLALPEALSGQHLVHDAMNTLTGFNFPLKYEKRLGLERAYSVFEHPIHYGSFCASVLAMIWYTERQTFHRWKKCLLIGAATLLGLSSAPMLSLALQIALITWDRMTRTIDKRLTMSFVAFCGLYFASLLIGNRTPAAFIATGMTLDSWTGYYRLVIWEAGIENIQANPMTGIGLGDWTRPWWMYSDSVDAFWLLIPLRAGIPAIVLLVGGIALLFRRVIVRARTHPSPDARRFQLGWAISVVAISLVGCTVHYWNALYAYLFFLIGLGGWLADPLPVRVAASDTGASTNLASAAPPARRRRPDKPARLRPTYAAPRRARA
jgi:O-antigen ligase